jgi:AbrB family looped-hinge helix DNA binding protein
MAIVVESDGSGRIVIPKKIRDEFGISGRTQFLLTSNEKGQILLQKIDVEEIARRLEEELGDKPVEELAESIRKEINEKIRSRHPGLSP